jgi:hypothetical protein
MANILKTTLNSKGNWINSPESLATVTLDADVLPSEIGDYLPDNSETKYDKEFGLIPSGSTLKLLMSTYWYLCQFNAEVGTYDSKTDRMSGKWLVMSKVKYIF